MLAIINFSCTSVAVDRAVGALKAGLIRKVRPLALTN